MFLRILSNFSCEIISLNKTKAVMIIVNYYRSYTQSDAPTDLILCCPSQESASMCHDTIKINKTGNHYFLCDTRYTFIISKNKPDFKIYAVYMLNE